MHHILRGLVLVLLGFILTASYLLGGGRTVTVLLNNGETITSELISVRTAELLLVRGKHTDDDALAKDPSRIDRVSYSTIKRVQAEGHNFAPFGVLLGAGVGMLVGASTSSGQHAFDFKSSGPDVCDINQVMETLLLSTAGCVVAGLIVGSAISSEKISIEGNQADILRALKSEARYSREEPEFLQRLK